MLQHIKSQLHYLKIIKARITEVTMAPGGTSATYPLPESDAKHDEELQLEPVPVPFPHHHASEWL